MRLISKLFRVFKSLEAIPGATYRLSRDEEKSLCGKSNPFDTSHVTRVRVLELRDGWVLYESVDNIAHTTRFGSCTEECFLAAYVLEPPDKPGITSATGVCRLCGK